MIRFDKSIHTALWGTESWEISVFESDPSRVANGANRGKTLRDIFPEFPLLFKVIDAQSRLSVQVHPNEVTCLTTGGDPKTEMWCALSDGPIYAGLRAGVTAKDVEAAIRSGRFEELLVRHEAKAGDAFFIPGGLVHAIGDGVRLYEVQQSSNTTFRLYDWGRVGADGQPRELHIEKGLQAVDYSLVPPQPCQEIASPFFNFSQMKLIGETTLTTRADEFLALFVARGEVTVDGIDVGAETSLLLAPNDACTLRATDAHLFVTRAPRSAAQRMSV